MNGLQVGAPLFSCKEGIACSYDQFIIESESIESSSTDGWPEEHEW